MGSCSPLLGILGCMALCVLACAHFGSPAANPSANLSKSTAQVVPPAPASPLVTSVERQSAEPKVVADADPALASVAPVEASQILTAETAVMFGLPGGMMSFVPARGSAFEPMALSQNGAITQGSRFVGKLAGNALFHSDGTPMATLRPDGVVEIFGSGTTYMYHLEGALEGMDGLRVDINAEGEVTLLESRRDGVARHIGRFDGVTRHTYRTAGLLILMQQLHPPASSTSSLRTR